MSDQAVFQAIQQSIVLLVLLGHDPQAMLEDREYALDELALVLAYLAAGALIVATTPMEMPMDVPGWE